VIDEYENEKIKGLPQDLPTGEALLWQGSPDWRSLFRHMVHGYKVAAYFALLGLWSMMSTLNDGGNAGDILLGLGRVLFAASIGLGLLAVIAKITARTTVYSITSRRVVMRIGMVLPMTVNLPYRAIGSADVKNYTDGTGDIALGISSGDRLAYLHVWPHVRPWRINNPEPALRSLPDVQKASHILGTALAAFAASNPQIKPAAARMPLFPVGRTKTPSAEPLAARTAASSAPDKPRHRNTGMAEAHA